MDAQPPKHALLDAAGLAGTLFQEAGDGLLLVDPLSERVLDANPMACQLSEFTREELVRLSIRGLVKHEQEWQDWLLPVQQTMAYHGKDGFLLRTRRGEKWVPITVTISRLHPPDGDALALFTLRDRREQVEAYRRVQRTEAELRRVLVSVSDCLWSCRVEPDGRWRYRYLSPVIQKLTGRSVGVFLEDPRAREQAVADADLARWREFVDRLASGYSAELEYRMSRPDGSVIWVRESVTTAPDDGGLLLHGVISDITERKRGEEEAARRQHAERQRLDTLAALAGKMAHDFNNLMTGVLGHVGLARTDPASVSLDSIEGLALRAADLCRRLGTFAGNPVGSGLRADLGTAIGRAAEARRPALPPGVTLSVGPADPLLVVGDSGQVGELIGHLLDNAIEAAGPMGRVSVRALSSRPESLDAPDFDYASGPLVWLEVTDDGPGIAADVRPRLFEPFVTNRPGRQGLGLAAVLGIVRGHKGAIQVSSHPDEGTRVRIGLPAAEPATAAPPAPAPEPRPGQPLVLLADDEATVREVVTRLIESLGCKVIAARDGEEALALFRQHADAVRLAIVDLTMPRMDGEPTMRQLRAESSGLPLVVMSGYPEADLSPRFADLGLAGYLQKPFRLPALVAVLRQAMVL
jgi:PAS domain S-box-containing protein